MNFTPQNLQEEPLERAEQLMLLKKLTDSQKSERLAL